MEKLRALQMRVWFFTFTFIYDTKAKVTFSVWGIIMMILAVALGQLLGGYLVEYLGSLGGGIVGSLVVGLACYAIYTLLTSGAWGIMPAVLFAVIIYVANLAAAYVDTMFGLGGGIITLVVTGALASLLWGWVGGKGKGKGKPLKLGKL
jgi:hypothetical protein